MVENQELITSKVGKLERVVLYRFYQKPMTNLLVNLRSNAAPDQTKMATVSQEIVRRLKTTSRDLHHSVVEGVLLKYMEELRIGGHTLEFRKEALDSATRGYTRMWEKQVKGEGWVNRPEGSTRQARRHNKLLGKTNWFKNKT